MSLSYRKARTAPSRESAGRAYQVAGGSAGAAAAQTYTAPEPDSAAGSGTNRAQPEQSSTNWSPEDNVVELFPGAAGRTGGWWSRFRSAEAGMATAEYAIATLAAVGFAGLLVVILRSDEVRGFLMSIVQQALTLG